MEGLFVSHPSLSVEFDQEMFPLEAQLSDLGPAEGIDLCVSLITVYFLAAFIFVFVCFSKYKAKA